MRIGSLCSGYGGLDLAAAEVFGGELAWWSDIHPAAVAVMTHHHPDAPNLGDLTKVTWWDVPPVDILCAGYPCQPFSNAGRRLGIDDPRHLWPWIARAIGALRPRIVVLENVAAHLRRGFDTVLADLAVLGYDAVWVVVRASDVGAPHRRARLFVVATDTDRPTGIDQRCLTSGSTEGVEPQAVGGTGRGGGSSVADTARERRHGTGSTRSGRWSEPTDGGGVASDTEGDGRSKRRPEPARPSGRPHVAADGGATEWGRFEPAIRRWERVIGRSAPAATVTGKRGSQQLSPQLVEWMMGLPGGYVTSVPGLSRNDMLHVLGNGVVPQCGAWAIEGLAPRLGIPMGERAA